MALLTEGTAARTWIYKHGPPDGGRTHLTPRIYKHGPPDGGHRCATSVYKHGPPDGGRTYLTPWMYKDETPDDGGRASHPGSTNMKPLTGFSTRYRLLSIIDYLPFRLLSIRQLLVNLFETHKDTSDLHLELGVLCSDCFQFINQLILCVD